MRQFILENQKIKNGLVVLEGKDFRYLRQVLRVKAGDMLNVRFPDGTLQTTTVAKVDDKSKKITIQICGSNKSTGNGASGVRGSSASDGESATITRGVQATEINDVLTQRDYWLFQFIPKPQKFEQIVRQATECGIAKIVPVIGEYSEKSSVQALQNSKKERLERVIKEARQQSGSAVATEVLEPVTLDKAIELWKAVWEDAAATCDAAAAPSDAAASCDAAAAPTTAAPCDAAAAPTTAAAALGLVLSERTDNCVQLRELSLSRQNIKHVAVAVGSEGGISPAEVAALCEKGLFSPVHFAVNILRCETAALYGIAAIQSALE